MQGGEHHINMGGSRLKAVYSQAMRSVHMSGEHLGSMSSVKVSCPAFLQTLDTLLVPQHMSQMSMERFLYQAGSYCRIRARLHAYEAHWSSKTRFRLLGHSILRCKSPWHPPPRVGSLQGQRVSLPERRRQLQWVVLIKRWERL